MSPKVENWEPTPTFWVAVAALVFALAGFAVSVSGIATASPKVIVRKGDIAPGAVTTKALAKGAVTAPKIQKATITAAKLKNGAVTAPKLADGSVTATALGNGSVTASKLGPGSVTAPAIAGGAVTSGAIAPLSVGAAQMGEEEVVLKPIADLDVAAHNNEWTASNLEVAVCGPGQRLLGGGFSFTTLNNGESNWIEELPIINGEVKGVAGRVSSDAGGTAGGNIAAICLK
jgi:hypothetical protein